MLQFISDLKCPYCDRELKLIKTFGVSKSFGIVKCDCEEYPFFNNLLILLKDDYQLNRRIRELLPTLNLYKIIWSCLAGTHMARRLLIVAAYFFKNEFRIEIAEKKMYFLLKMLSREKSWFEYLLKREKAPDFRNASDMFSKSKIRGLIADVGCGTGIFTRRLLNLTSVQSRAFGFDRSIMSLLIAGLYNRAENILFVLTDVEQSVPLQDSVVDNLILMDSLPWIYNKKNICRESGRIVRKQGMLYIFNIFSPVGKAKLWGDGIFPLRLRSLLALNFSKIRFINNKQKNLKKINDYDYNVIAERK